MATRRKSIWHSAASILPVFLVKENRIWNTDAANNPGCILKLSRLVEVEAPTFRAMAIIPLFFLNAGAGGHERNIYKRSELPSDYQPNNNYRLAVDGVIGARKIKGNTKRPQGRLCI